MLLLLRYLICLIDYILLLIVPFIKGISDKYAILQQFTSMKDRSLFIILIFEYICKLLNILFFLIIFFTCFWLIWINDIIAPLVLNHQHLLVRE